MSGRVLGSKYQHGRDVAEIAKLVRADIKAAVASGSLPGGKYGVTIERYSMGRAVNIRFVVGSAEFRVFNAARLRAEAAQPYECASRFPEGAQERWTPATTSIVAVLEEILAAYKLLVARSAQRELPRERRA